MTIGEGVTAMRRWPVKASVTGCRLAALLPLLSTLVSGCQGAQIELGQGALDAGIFGTPVIVPGLAANGYDDFKETLTADMLELYFCSDRPGGPGNQDIWVSTRTATSAPWGTPSCVTELSSAYHETGTAVSADGLTIWLSSDRPGGKGGYDIWTSTRASRDSSWSTPTTVTELDTAGDEFPRAPTASGLVMPPSYRSAPNNQYQTYMTSRPDAAAPWSKAVRLTEVDTSNINTDAFLTDDELALYFSSDRTVAGDQDLFIGTRSDKTAPFGSFAPLSELNVRGKQDRDPWLSPDGHVIYFSSDRSGTLKIYVAAR